MDCIRYASTPDTVLRTYLHNVWMRDAHNNNNSYRRRELNGKNQFVRTFACTTVDNSQHVHTMCSCWNSQRISRTHTHTHTDVCACQTHTSTIRCVQNVMCATSASMRENPIELIKILASVRWLYGMPCDHANSVVVCSVLSQIYLKISFVRATDVFLSFFFFLFFCFCQFSLLHFFGHTSAHCKSHNSHELFAFYSLSPVL